MMVLPAVSHRIGAVVSIVLSLGLFPWSVQCDQNDDLQERWGSDWAFSGISTFNHLPHTKCLVNRSEEFDIGIVGVPFDSLTTYRTGAREGPKAIRWASGRHLSGRSFHPTLNFNPYESWAKVLDCGDIPVIPNDPVLGIQQIEEGLTEMLLRPTPSGSPWEHPRLVLLGGDHSIVLPMLRALKNVRKEPVALLHFDAHIDTMAPDSYPRNSWKSQASEINHGTIFWQAAQENLLIPGHLVHAGVHGRISSLQDFHSDDKLGFLRIPVQEIDDLGSDAIMDRIYNTIGGNTPVYVSIDIDVLDPAFAPGTGAPETGGWSSRELMHLMTVLSKLRVVGLDIVEVTPAYDSAGGDTAFAAANLAYESISMMVLSAMDSESSKQEEDTGNHKTEL